MTKKNYIYNNPSLGYNYQPIPLEEIVSLIQGIKIVLCSSSWYAETNDNLRTIQCNCDGILLPHRVDLQINEKKNKINFGWNDTKNEIYKKLEIDEMNSVATENRIFGDADFAPTESAQKENGIVFCADYHEAAYALSYGIPYIFLISVTDLANHNGPNNYRNSHIEIVNRLCKIIKNNGNI